MHALHPRRSERRPDQILTFSSVGHFCANLQANGEPRCRLCPPGSPAAASAPPHPPAPTAVSA